ncbi:MAG: pectinesterase family protein [Bacteroidota bacterium]
MSFIRRPDNLINVYIIGDSTAANKLPQAFPETGWGMELATFFDSTVKIDNRALNGRSTKSFIAEKRWAAVLTLLRAGDYVLIQFGHNDEKIDKPGIGTSLSEYKANLIKYVEETRAKKANPVLLTPIMRRNFKNGVLKDTHGSYPEVVRHLADSLGVPLIDMHRKTTQLLTGLGDLPSIKLFNYVDSGHVNYPTGKKDDTHLSPEGAKVIAKLVAQSIKGLAKHLKLSIYDIIVAADGSGNYKTVQEAINAVPDFRKTITTIFIKNGIYKEKLNLSASKQLIKMIGESVTGTILTFDDWAQKKNTFGEEKGTSGSASFYIYGSGFSAENITFQNTAGPVGQAVALFVAGDRAKFTNCRMLGFQDTLYTYGYDSRQYYYQCYIEGTVDFIFGSSTAVFEECEIFCKKEGYITASSSPDTAKYGYVFINSKVKGDAPENSYYLGRPWRSYAKTVFITCDLGKMIKPAGWDNWGKVSNEKTAFYAEYNNTGPGAYQNERVSWSHQLNEKTIQEYTLAKILMGWDPKE